MTRRAGSAWAVPQHGSDSALCRRHWTWNSAPAAEGTLTAYMAAYGGLGPEGILRIAVFSSHTDDMLEQLILAMGRHL
ncbi:MAG: hypothetical protein MUF48_14670 [Pirellulaceae bacterium]|nr:hypothetical protein [Pirellulaceae bacterium]